MAIAKTTTQYSYTGAKPLDSKALVQTYELLTKPETWTVDGVNIAYNGMITAVWFDKKTNENGDTVLSDKNGIYFLFDPDVTSTRGDKAIPKVNVEANWHKLGGIDSLPGLAEQIAKIKSSLEAVQKDVRELKNSATEVVETFEQLPETGVPGKLYIVTEDATTYVWYNDKYLLVGDGADENDIQIIHGGSAI